MSGIKLLGYALLAAGVFLTTDIIENWNVLFQMRCQFCGAVKWEGRGGALLPTLVDKLGLIPSCRNCGGLGQGGTA